MRSVVEDCLIGGAVGDALGAPVEFMSGQEIANRFGDTGVREFLPAYGRLGAVTDDTQMTLFTMEGLIRGKLRWLERGLVNRAVVLHRAYLRWLLTQGHEVEDPYGVGLDVSWLNEVEDLNHCRAPGNTCLSALISGQMGTPDKPINRSKGCGGIMRAAPAGLTGSGAVWSFEAGCEFAAITHGHPSGWLAAGAFAAIVAELAAGKGFTQALDTALRLLAKCGSASSEVVNTLNTAQTMAEATLLRGIPTALGEGWVAEETLAIAVYCCLATSNFESAVSLSVSHGGDSDSTGSVTGNFAGLMYGQSAIPELWCSQLELKDTIKRLTDHFEAVVLGEPDLDRWLQVYPPN